MQTREGRYAWASIVAVVGLTLVAVCAAGAAPLWETMIVDSRGGALVSVASSPNGFPAMTYEPWDGGGITYAWYDGTQWRRATITSSFALEASLAVVPAGWPAVSFYDATTAALKYAWSDGSMWHSEPVTAAGDVGRYPSLKFLSSGQPVISYWDPGDGAVKYAWRDDDTWQTTVVDPHVHFVTNTSLAILSTGYPAVSYQDWDDGGLKYAAFDGAVWQVTSIDSGPAGDVSLAVLPSGDPAISYGVASGFYGSALRYAWYDGSGWQTQTLDDAGGSYSCLAISPAGYPVIAHRDPLSAVLKYTWFDGALWRTATIDGSSEFGGVGLAMLPTGRAVVGYVSNETSGEVKCAVRLDPPVTIYVNGQSGNDDWSGRCAEWNGNDCGPKRTIQVGVNAAWRGDSVEIAPGTYTGPGNRDVDYLGKAITVRSVDPNDPAVVASTVIDCQGTPEDRHRAFTFSRNEGPDSLLAGVTMENGCAPVVAWPEGWLAPAGGAVLCWKTSPAFDHCVFSDNAAGWGGAVVSAGPQYDGGNPSFLSCTFANNRATEFSSGSSICFAEGGACGLSSGAPVFSDCRFVDNSATPESYWAGGGAVSIAYGEAMFSRCEFRDNSVPVRGVGGAIFRDYDFRPLVLADCVLVGNYSAGNVAQFLNGGGGGAIRASTTELTLTNCVLAQNSTTRIGGGIAAEDCLITMTSCTLTANSAGAGGRGHAVSSAPGFYVSVMNSVIWNGNDWRFISPSLLTVQYSDVSGGWTGAGNIDIDPLFVDAAGGDYHLSPVSPCINRGSNTVPRLPEHDLDGNPRIHDCATDMGAYESHYPVELHDCNGNGVDDACDIAVGTSTDCDANGVPDECDPDCNGNGVPDACDITQGTAPDCNHNGVPDECVVAAGTSGDCNGNGIPDECEPECNGNGVPDSCDIAAGTSSDCNGNGIPDECELDCNGNGVPDGCDIAAGTSGDCSDNGIPDECEPDCNGNGLADSCDIVNGTSQDRNSNGVPDECEINPGDTNCDGVINFADINPFVLALSGRAAYELGFPNCLWINADCNGDNSVNFADINPFVARLTGGR